MALAATSMGGALALTAFPPAHTMTAYLHKLTPTIKAATSLQTTANQPVSSTGISSLGLVSSSGEVASMGSLPSRTAPIQQIAGTKIVGGVAIPGGKGYWLVSQNGVVYPFGSAQSLGDMYSLGFTGLGGTHPLPAPVVAIATTHNGNGYWLATSDGSVYSFGTAKFHGSTFNYGLTGLSGPHPLNAPIVGMATTPNANGYYLVAADGGVFNFGSAEFHGSAYSLGLTGLSGPHPLNAPIVGMATTPNARGYYLVAADGGVFNFGSAEFHGSAYSLGFTGLNGPHPIKSPVVSILPSPTGTGYYLIGSGGDILSIAAPALSPPANGGKIVAILDNTTTPKKITAKKPAPTPTSTPPPQHIYVPPAPPALPTTNTGMFLQVSSLSPTYSTADVASWMQDMCSTGTSTVGKTLVLQDIVNSSGDLNRAYLNVIVPYLPGYSSCFSKVYIGTTTPPYTGSGTLYDQGVQSSTYRDTYVSDAETLAASLLAAYPKLQANWYISLESEMNYLDMPAVESAYETIITEEISDLSILRPNASFLWSPGFLYGYSGVSSYDMGLLTTGLSNLFSSISATKAPFTIDLQDEVGGTACYTGGGALTTTDAIDWAKYLDGITGHPPIEMNSSLFTTDCTTNGLVALTSSQIKSEEETYTAAGIPLGPAYEIRYWLAANDISLIG